jgi:ariadne-1
VDNSEALLKRCGVGLEWLQEQQPVTGTMGEGTCSICFDTTSDVTTLSCQHGFCASCWKNYLSIKIKEKEQIIRCPGYKCDRVIDELTVHQLAESPELIQQFNETLVNSFVDSNPFVRWCPAPSKY